MHELDAPIDLPGHTEPCGFYSNCTAWFPNLGEGREEGVWTPVILHHVDLASSEAKVILGMDFLHTHGVVLDLAEGVMKLDSSSMVIRLACTEEEYAEQSQPFDGPLE